jgi:hypothetical protein
MGLVGFLLSCIGLRRYCHDFEKLGFICLCLYHHVYIQKHCRTQAQVKKLSKEVWEMLKHTKILTKIEEKTQDLEFEFF